MLFRTQTIAVLEDGAVMAADDETVELYATTGGFGSLGELLRKQSVPTRSVDLDVLARENAADYWERDERHDLSISLNRGQPALDALCARAGALDRALPRRRRCASCRSGASTTTAGCGTSGSTPRRAAC